MELTIEEFIVEQVFNITTYDDTVSSKLVLRLFEVCEAISTRTTYDYIKDTRRYLWYITLLNTPLLRQITEWGSSIRGAWWNPKMTISGCWLWYSNNQPDKVELTSAQWIDFLQQLKELWNTRKGVRVSGVPYKVPRDSIK